MKMPTCFRIKNLSWLLISVLAFGTMPLFAGETAKTDTQVTSHKPKIDYMALARGAQAWSHICGSCHNLRDPKELTDAEWDVAMGQMSVRAGLTAEQFRDISLFLKSNN